MGSFATFAAQIDVLNKAVRDSFGVETIQYQQRANNGNVNPPVSLKAIPLDPIRLENVASGQFTVRFILSSDISAANITPKKGDRVRIPNSGHTIGGNYNIHQVQADVAGGIRLILNLLDNRQTGVNVE